MKITSLQVLKRSGTGSATETLYQRMVRVEVEVGVGVIALRLAIMSIAMSKCKLQLLLCVCNLSLSLSLSFISCNLDFFVLSFALFHWRYLSYYLKRSAFTYCYKLLQQTTSKRDRRRTFNDGLAHSRRAACH